MSLADDLMKEVERNRRKAEGINEEEYIAAQRKEESAKAIELRRNAYDIKNMLMTTTHSFEGYSVDKYIDIVSEEVVFKNSFMKKLSASFSNAIDSFNLWDHEMSGPTSLISNAKLHVINKVRTIAYELGGNALLGVSFDSTIGTDICKVSMTATVVHITTIK